MVLFDGEGVPSPTPPRVISPRSGAWGDAGEGYNRGCFLRPAFPGISPALPPPGAGEEREAREGWGRRRAVSGFAFLAAPILRPHHESARSRLRGTLGRASMVLLDGEGAPHMR